MKALLSISIFLLLMLPLPAHAEDLRAWPAIDKVALVSMIHELVNSERAANGVGPLALDPALSKIAEGHSADMAGREVLTHYSSDGRSFSARYKAGGYVCQREHGQTIYLGAENVSLDHLYTGATVGPEGTRYNWQSPEAIAASVVKRWMQSPGHRANILSPVWKNEGIGISVSPSGAVLVTQNFC